MFANSGSSIALQGLLRSSSCHCIHRRTISYISNRLYCLDSNKLVNFCQPNRLAHAKQRPTSREGGLVETKEKPFSELTVGQKVKRVGTDATYTGVVVVGIGVTAMMFYFIGRELLSGQSPSGIYSKALKKCRKNDEVHDTLGSPIKGFGEMNRRGRSRHVSHTVYEVDGVKHMRMKFYLKGTHHRGTVHLEVKQNERGKYEFRYLFVEPDDTPYRRTIMIEDNR